MSTYDRRTAQYWDSSSLGLDPDDVEAMDDDERVEAAVDSLNRAADLLQAAVKAFEPQYGGDAREIEQVARKLIQIARKR
jgi:hypothetical protein